MTVNAIAYTVYFIITRRHRYAMRIYRHTYTLSNVWISTKRGNKAWRISRQMTACTASWKSGYFPDGWFCLSLVQKYSQPWNPIPNHRLDVFSTPMNHWDKLWKTTYQLVIAGFQLPTRTDCWKFQRFDERIVIRGNTQSTEQRLVYPGVVCGECSCGLKSLTPKMDGWNTKLTTVNIQ